MDVNWIKCQGDKWCSFYSVDLSKVTAHGVYIIWYRGNPGRVVYIGKGDIAKRIREHRQESVISAYRQYGLLVTWAVVQDYQQDGIEKYLSDVYSPLTGQRHPNVEPISVNTPWP